MFSLGMSYLKNLNADATVIIPKQITHDTRDVTKDAATDESALGHIAATHTDPDSLIRALNGPHRHRLTDDDGPAHHKTEDYDRSPETPILPTSVLIGSGLATLAALRKRKQISFNQ